MGCGGSRARASTPVAGNVNQNGRSDSAPVNGSQGSKPTRDLQSASTVVLGARSNTNLNNNSGPNNSLANVSDDNKNTSASKVDIGHVVDTASTDSVFVRNEVLDTHRQDESVTETLADRSVQLGEEEATSEPNEAADSPEQKGEAGDKLSSSGSRNKIDECNSISQLPKKDPSSEGDDIVINNLEDGNSVGGSEEQRTQSEAVPQEDKVNEPSPQEPEQVNEEERVENAKESQPEATDEGIAMDAEEIKDTDSEEDVTTEPQNIQVAEPLATTTQLSEGDATDKVRENSSTTDTAANEESPAAVEANNNREVDESATKDVAVAEWAAPASDDNATDNNVEDQAEGVDTTEPTQVEEKNEDKQADGDSSETQEEMTPSGDSEESATSSNVQETQNEQQQEDDP